jgi:hypothetical protein
MALIIENGLADAAEGADNFICEDMITTGVVIWVDSVNGNNSNSGTENSPLATLAQAITNSTANNGDIIVVKSGHAETLTSAITINKAGVKIFGIGDGSDAPKFTCNAAIDCITVSAPNVEINNFYFPAGTTATNTARIDINAAHVRVKGCTFLCGLYDQHTITLTSSALYAEIDSCTFTVSADGPDDAIIVESASASALEISNCAFNGATYNWDDAALYSTVAHTNFIYDSNTLTGDAVIKHTAAAKGILSNTIAAEGSTVQA